MRDFLWLERRKRIVFKSEPFELWRTGTIKEVFNETKVVSVVKDSSKSCDGESVDIQYRNIVGEATEKFTPFPFFWHNVLDHLTEEAKENL
jgi:hypothetical protein